jgi:hypothetical protein
LLGLFGLLLHRDPFGVAILLCIEQGTHAGECSPAARIAASDDPPPPSPNAHSRDSPPLARHAAWRYTRPLLRPSSAVAAKGKVRKSR